MLTPSLAAPDHPPDIDWWRTGVIPPAGTYDKYWTDPYTLFTIEVVAMQFAELKRLQDFRYPGSQGKQYFLGLEKIFEGSGNPAYPGGPFFNLFNLGEPSPPRRGAHGGSASPHPWLCARTAPTPLSAALSPPVPLPPPRPKQARPRRR
jgi:hypothetical protein